jgi:DNA-binding MurR/RpiR family transcriptional regulator
LSGAAETAEATKPATLAELSEHVSRHRERLSPRAFEAARHVLAHPNDIALSPLAAVSRASGVAGSAFIRMAQALGFSGYGELQRLCQEPLQRASPPSFQERIRHVGGEQAVNDASDPTELLRAFAEANRVSLDHLRGEAGSLPLAAAIGLLRQARLVHVLGLRRSYAVAAYLAYALNRVGRPAVQITGLGGAAAEQASAVQPGDLLVAISFPPYARDTLAVCEQVKACGARRLALTDSVLSPVAEGADLVLQVNDAELLGFRSLTSALCVAQALAMGLAFRERKSARKAKRGGGEKPGPALARAALDDIDC